MHEGGLFINQEQRQPHAQEKQLPTNGARYLALYLFAALLLLFALLCDAPSRLLPGLSAIFGESGMLITDYVAVGGLGATFLNAGLLTLLSILLLQIMGMEVEGIAIAAVFLMAGFALFGKNLLNVWPIILGVWLYARVRKESFKKHVYTAMFGTSLAPAVSEIALTEGLPLWLRLLLALAVGVGIGLVLPPMAMHFFRFHQGYSLYNVGFAAGILGTVLVAVLRSYGFTAESRLIWSVDSTRPLLIFLLCLFGLMLVAGMLLTKFRFRSFFRIFHSTGHGADDFLHSCGFGAALMNMSLCGLMGISYVLLVGGALNGPTVGGILTMAGFGAAGKHMRNMLPLFIGVYLGSLTKIWGASDPQILLAALFGTALAPISGEFGFKYGVLAGFINSSVVLNVGGLHGGLNLYNTGFSSGIVAAALVPVIEAFRRSRSHGGHDITESALLHIKHLRHPDDLPAQHPDPQKSRDPA